MDDWHMGGTCIQAEPRLIVHPALLGNRCRPGCRAGRIGLHRFLHPPILQAMLHVARGEHDQADDDQAGQGPNPLRFRCLCSADATNYAVEVGIGDGSFLCSPSVSVAPSRLVICACALFVCHD